MQASDYLRMKFQNDRRLALTTQNAVGGVLQSARGVASDIYSGMERASWYSSCFIPQYNDVCQELKTEEIRTLYSIESIYRYRDVIAYMLYLYFKMISDDVDEGNPEGSARQLIRKMSAIASHMNIAGGTRYAFASAASLALSQSGFMSKIIVERLSAKLPQAVFVLQFFGVQQKCALAARHLKAVDSNYYWILYQAKLEMLYYFVEPAISKMISRAKSQLFSNLDDLADFLQGDFSV
ncbi:hypothetical protein [Citrobacter cronae]|uniref:hypothetical protein n=1 Tax=Citrobacter cronae TaxID=1748967 RepID=UPI001900A2A5|nr:hypothetical protein [Citrobacter cronae]MBJ8416236.1 hypothetical protein [Citrobacter cronae]MCM8844457.1 hypothetical protein [Citrobacter cronae]